MTPFIIILDLFLLYMSLSNYASDGRVIDLVFTVLFAMLLIVGILRLIDENQGR